MMFARPTLLFLLLSRALPALASPQPSSIWVESGANLLWDPMNLGPALTEGRGEIINACVTTNCTFPEWELLQPTALNFPGNLPAGATSETFAGNLLTGSTPPDGGQYYCYVVLGSAAGPQDFSSGDWTFNCSQVPPDTDNSPSSALQVQNLVPIGPLQANGNFAPSTWDAGFVGSMFRLPSGQGWQPWFRNGEEVIFDMPDQLPVMVPQQPAPPAAIASMAVPVDPGFYLGSVQFTSTHAAQQTLTLPRIFATGTVIELQLSNSDATSAFGNPFPSATVGILGGDGQYIGEASVGPVLPNPPGSGTPRLSTYRIDASNIVWTYPNTSLTFDMTGHLPQAGQFVTVGVVVHGYHEQLLK